jgi:hypothetical protein
VTIRPIVERFISWNPSETSSAIPTSLKSVRFLFQCERAIIRAVGHPAVFETPAMRSRANRTLDRMEAGEIR